MIIYVSYAAVDVPTLCFQLSVISLLPHGLAHKKDEVWTQVLLI